MRTGVIKGQEVLEIDSESAYFGKGAKIIIKLDTGERCLMHVHELYRIINDLKFEAVPKRKYSHLNIIGWDCD